MTTKKLKRRLQDAYGKAPNPFYFDGDMAYIRAYYDFRRIHQLDPFLIDDTTWNDLDMDQIFKRINPKRCTSGEQYLYYMLRSPCVDEKRFLRRKAVIQASVGLRRGRTPPRRAHGTLQPVDESTIVG